MDFEVDRCSRECAASGRALVEGEEFFSVLVAEGSQVRRLDYAAEAWSGAPAGALGWWKSRMPAPAARKARLAPSDVLLELFHSLAEVEASRDMRYVLALLMVRRRILRLEETLLDDAKNETLVLYSPRDEQTYEVPAVLPDEQRTQEIQDELARLLFADATT